MVQFRSMLLALLLAGAPLFLLVPCAASAQDAEPNLPAMPKAKAPDPSAKPFIFTAIYLILVLAVAAALTVALAVAYRSNRFSGPIACFLAGAALLTCPIFGIGGNIAGQFVAVATMPANDGAPDPKTMANAMLASLPLAIFMWVSFLAFFIGVVTIVAAFFFKKPTQTKGREP